MSADKYGYRIAVDVGGTFTDIVVLDEKTGRLQLEKAESTPRKPAEGVLESVRKAKANLKETGYFVHGTTLALNALITRRGAKTCIITTKGFRDVYEIARTDRDPMYDIKYRKPPSLVPRYLRFEVEERITFEGEVLIPFNEENARQVARHVRGLGAEAAVVCFLHSYSNPDHELRMGNILREECPGLYITLSHRLVREYREYERTSTAVVDAYVKPIMESYLEELDGALKQQGFPGWFLLTRSGGGAMTVAAAKETPVHSVLSGPAGGVIGAHYLSEVIGQKDLITLDMGGTSLDTSLILGGKMITETDAKIGGLPIMVPTIDIRTIGAGGGSIAWIDEGGHLQVGPQSAGAEPGPICYSKGGTDPTITDAALVIGYIDPGYFLGGEIKLDRAAAADGIQKRVAAPLGFPLEQAAAGILAIAETKITGAIREITVERGYHPKDFALVPYGGAGGLIASSVSRELGVPRVIVPVAPANFSAWGMLMVDVIHDVGRTYVTALADVQLATISEIYADLERQGLKSLASDGFAPKDCAIQRSAELRYLGQEHSVSMAIHSGPLGDREVDEIARQFNELHEQKYGHRMEDPVELVHLRVRAVGLLAKPELARIRKGPGGVKAARKGERPVYLQSQAKKVPYQLYERAALLSGDTIDGPAIIEEPTSTTILHAGDRLVVGEYGELAIDVGGEA